MLINLCGATFPQNRLSAPLPSGQISSWSPVGQKHSSLHSLLPSPLCCFLRPRPNFPPLFDRCQLSLPPTPPSVKRTVLCHPPLSRHMEAIFLSRMQPSEFANTFQRMLNKQPDYFFTLLQPLWSQVNHKSLALQTQRMQLCVNLCVE